MIVLGLMSGTSLDGLDMALMEFTNDGKTYELISASTVKYPNQWVSTLKKARDLSKSQLSQLHKDYGDFLGQQSVLFLKGKKSPDLISSHGHTVYHEPEKGITFQIGNLDNISSVTGIETVGDFRSLDVSKGGQGAPLVPVGDDILFSDYDYCVNLGGISNYSTTFQSKRIAKDISPCNIVSNILANKLGYEFDRNGDLGKSGRVRKDLLEKLNSWSYYDVGKSLGFEKLEKDFLPILSDFNSSIEDKLRTYYEHIGQIIGGYLKGSSKKALFTGGGAKNLFLMSCIDKYSECQKILPESDIIDFKEAIIFGLLGYLRIKNKINILSSVTGASSDSCSGKVSHPKL